jgi:TIR domain
MKPGERIRLIRESADSLLTRPWPEAQLTLDQFGFKTYEPNERYIHEFDEHDYFIQQIKDGADDELADLHEYLLGDDAAPTTRSGGMAPWTASLPLTVFLSHIHAHREFIGNVKQILARRGIDAFVAHDDIHPSQQWREVIKAALGTCHAFVAFLHEGFHQSQWCDQEVGWALGRGIPVITVRPAGVHRRDGFLEEHQDLFMAGPRVTELWVADQIVDILLRDPRTESLGARVLAEAVVNSGSYDTTRKFFGLLYVKPTIEVEQLRRLEYAVQTNRQVYEAVYVPPGETTARPVPDLVEELVKRHSPPPPPPVYGDEEPF